MKIYLPRLFLNPITIFVVIFGVLVARSWSALVIPELALEDGRDLLAFFFNSPNPASALRSYNGYLSFVSNAIAWLATRGPITLAPYIFALASLGFAAAGMFMISRPQFAWLIPNAIDRAIIALLLAVLPLGRGRLINNLDYSLWSLLFLLIVLLAYPLPRSPLRLVLRSILIILCIFSHPLSIVVVPICIIHLVREKGLPQRLCVGLFLLAIVLYQIFGVDHSSSLVITLQSFALALKLFLTRVLLEIVSGAKASVALLAAAPGGGDLLGIAVLLFLVFLSVTDDSTSQVQWATAIALLLMFGLVFASVAARMSRDFVADVFNAYFQRYFYVPKLVLAIFLLSQAVPRLRKGVSSVKLLAKCSILIGVAAYLVQTNRINNSLYQNSVTEGRRVKAFLSDVQTHVQRAKAGLPYTSEWILPREEPWSVALSINKHLRKS
jgi:hypothetical protein